MTLPLLFLSASIGYTILSLYEPTRFRAGLRLAEAAAMIGTGSLLWYGLSTLS